MQPRGSRSPSPRVDAREALLLVLAVIVGGAVCVTALAIGSGRGGPGAAELAAQADYGIMAGHEIAYPCFGNFYARHGDAVVLIAVAHCHSTEGSQAIDGRGEVLGTWGPIAQVTPCDVPAHVCLASDMTYIVLAPDRVPWGRLDQVLMGREGYRSIAGTRVLSCADIAAGAPVEVTGRARYRAGRVVRTDRYAGPGDVAAFPCIVTTDQPGIVGDSGGPVFVDGQPAGITSRRIDGRLAFTPLAEGLDALGLTLCTTPDCGLVPPPASGSATYAPETAAPASMTPAP